MVTYWNKFCKENDMIEVEQACPLYFLSDFPTKITDFSLPFPTFNTDNQIGSSSLVQEGDRERNTAQSTFCPPLCYKLLCKYLSLYRK